MRSKIKVVLADDHSFLLYGMETYLNSIEEIEVVAIASDGEDLLNKVRLYHPEVVVTDLCMPKLSGVNMVKELRKAEVERIIIYSMIDNETILFSALNSGAMSYVNKSTGREEIVKAIVSTYENESYFCSHMVKKVKGIMGSLIWKNSSQTILFTEEEMQIIELVCKERTSVEIAGELFKSKKVIDRARTRIFEKMGVKSSVGLVVYAIRNSMFPDFYPGFVT